MRPTFNIAGIYNLDDQQTFKVIYSEATQDNRGRDIDEPEEMRSLELAYEYVEDDFLINVSIFRNDAKNVLRTVLNSSLVGKP